MDLRAVPIFENLSDSDLEKIERNIKIDSITYPKNSYIFRAEDVGKDLYYMIKGEILVYKLDLEGNRSIIQKFSDRVIFGEIYAYLNIPYDFYAEAVRESDVLVIRDFKRLFTLDLSKDFYLSYINLISRKCLLLSQKNQIESKFSLRGKIANYLLLNEKAGQVFLKMNREQLADFLGVSRPALSRELSKMDRENILRVKAKKIEILNKSYLEDIV